MKLNELMEKYGEYEVKDGFMDFLEKPKPKTVWDLEYGDVYYFLNSCGNVTKTFWHNIDLDKQRLSICNAFFTEEDAEFARERLKVITELKKYAKEFSDEEWRNGNTAKYLFYRSFPGNRIYITSTYSAHYPCLYFESMEKAKQAFNAVGEERIKKYCFGVKG